MRRAFFFVWLAACGGTREPAHVEIAQPLPTVSVAATVAEPPPPEAPQPLPADDVGDPRPAPRQSIALLRTEARSLESLAGATPTSSPDLPAVLLRTAEVYVELRKSGEAGASQRAIDHYKTVTAQFPSFAKIDEAYFGLGVEYAASGDLAGARRAFYELIKNSPQSRYVPYAYFAFGDMFQREAKGDPSKWDFAKQAYFEVTKFSTSPIAAEALCRLSEVATAQGDSARATAERQRLARDYPNSAAARRCGGP